MLAANVPSRRSIPVRAARAMINSKGPSSTSEEGLVLRHPCLVSMHIEPPCRRSPIFPGFTLYLTTTACFAITSTRYPNAQDSSAADIRTQASVAARVASSSPHLRL